MKIKFLVLATWIGLGWMSGIQAQTDEPPPPKDGTLIFDGARGVQSLDGDWQALPIAGLDFTYPPPDAGWKTESVPRVSSNMFSGISGPYVVNATEYIGTDGQLKQKTGMAAWFKRDFDFPATLKGDQRALLVFKGMSYKSRVWLNGQEVGGNPNGLVPVSYDVTSVLKLGSKNELVIGLASFQADIDLKNVTFLSPVGGASSGIWGDVEVQIVPSTRIDDAYIKTSVKNKRIDVDVTVVNDGKEARAVSVATDILDDHLKLQTSLAPTPISINPGESRTVTLSSSWVAPHLWSPQTPALYFAQTHLINGEKTVDTHTDRFGFREFEIRGKDFYLNGERIVLLRLSILDGLGSHPSSEIFRAPPGNPYNTVRLHGGFMNTDALDQCDELGLMSIPESSWFGANPRKFPVDKKDLWLPNVEAYFKAFIRLHRNRPSIIIWNLTNETYWSATDPSFMAVADSILATVKSVDPIRPCEGDGENDWGGRLPIINLHYPESEVGNSLQAKYPDSAFVFPNDWHWLKQDVENTGWRAKFVWDRPLIIGEYWDTGTALDPRSSFTGESLYDWEKARFPRVGSLDGSTDSDEYFKAVDGMTDAYRMDGVAGVNPWPSGDRVKMMPSTVVRPVDFFPNFFGGQTSSRKFVVFMEDILKQYTQLNLLCRLTVNGTTVWEKVVPVDIASGENKIVDVPIEAPAVTQIDKATLTVDFRCWRGGGWNMLSFYQEPVFLMPPSSLAAEDASKAVLLDSDGQTAAALKKLGWTIPARTTLADSDLKGAKLLIVGSRTNATPFKVIIDSFAENGGSVLILQQDGTPALSTELPESDPAHISTRSWKRTFDSPITADLDDRQFSYWRPDHLVSDKTFYKPSGGAGWSLLDCGGVYGMLWSPLVEVLSGKGLFLASQLNLTDRIDDEPMAGLLLSRMIHYGLQFQPPTLAPLRLLAGTNKSLRGTLAAAGVVYTEGLNGTGPVLIDSTVSPDAVDIKALQGYLQDGGHVWLHGFSNANVAAMAGLFPFAPKFVPRDQTVLAATRRADDPLMNGLSSFDFFWTKIDTNARADIFATAAPTAALGGDVLQPPNVDAAVKLLEPGLLMKVPVGKGTLLVDTLLWEKALDTESEKTCRIVSSLALNQGVEIRPPGTDETEYAYSPIDLSQQANAGYYDQPGAAVPGWTHQGVNDMRFFLINHTGRAGGIETGPEIATEPFPTQVTFGHRPFSLTDPSKNHGRGVISLRGQGVGHGESLPDSVTGIPFGKKADKLWFLHSEGWPIIGILEFARAVIHYDDGTSEVFSFRYGVEGQDWWDPKPLFNGKVVWTGNNLMHSPVGVYLSEWANPHPNKVIQSIDFAGNLSPVQVVLLGITAGVANGGKPAPHPLGAWNFDDIQGNEVANQVPGSAALQMGDPAPEAATFDKTPCLLFHNGESLQADPSQIPGLADGGDFTMEITLAVEKVPESDACIYQSMEYLKNGFRFMLRKNMKLLVGVFSVEGTKFFTGNLPLQTNRFYSVKLVFNDGYASLFVDGRLDKTVLSGPPAPTKSGIVIGKGGGVASFDGWIRDLSFQANPVSS